MEITIGSKSFPQDKSMSAAMAAHFMAKGVKEIRESESFKDHVYKFEDVEREKITVMISSAGKLATGNLLFAQGMEILLKLIMMTEGVDDRGMPQHNLTQRFDLIKDFEPITKNIEKMVASGDASSLDNAVDTLQKAENAFMVSRYFGMGNDRSNLTSINPKIAQQLSMALFCSYQSQGMMTFFYELGLITHMGKSQD